jgi:S-disulfanyl-L-cysteine oxidoreductase SoxD
VRHSVIAGLAFLLAASASHAEQHQPLGIGRPPTDQEIGAVDIDIAPDGTGLPAGKGSVAAGAALFTAKCAACHGAHGEIGDDSPVPKLAGGQDTLATTKPLKTVGSYWPYATTLFDYIRRAMPLNAPQTLDADQTYAIAAFVLKLNGVVGDDAVLDARTLPAVRMPNRDGFIRTPNQPGS